MPQATPTVPSSRSWTLASAEKRAEEKYEGAINEITDLILNEYFQKNGSAEGKETISDHWRIQLEKCGYIVRRGVPQRLLIDVATDYIKEDAPKVNSPFGGGDGAEMIAEAERHAGENDFFERGMRELMKHMDR